MVTIPLAYKAAKLRDEVAQLEREQVPALKGRGLSLAMFLVSFPQNWTFKITRHFGTYAKVPKRKHVCCLVFVGDSALKYVVFVGGTPQLNRNSGVTKFGVPYGEVESTRSLKISAARLKKVRSLYCRPLDKLSKCKKAAWKNRVSLLK